MSAPWRDRRLLVAGAVLAALGVGQALAQAFPQERVATPYVREGVVGEPVSLRYGTVEVGEVTGSTSTESPTTVVRSPGVLLAVPLAFVPTGRPETLAYAVLRDREGRTYRTGNGVRTPYSKMMAQPGIGVRSVAVFELPVDAVAGAHLLLGSDALDERRDDLADVDLGLTDADAERWAAELAPIELTYPEMGLS